jgi:pantothenate kinase type III
MAHLLRMPSFLLVDNSNSFTKFALSSEAEVGEVRKLPTEALCPESIRTLLDGWSFEAAALCSVVPIKGAVLRFLGVGGLAEGAAEGGASP